MDNPYLTEQQAHRELAFVLWKIQEARNELTVLKYSAEAIRRRAKRQMITWVIGISFTAVASFFLVRYLYLYWFWQ